MLNDDLIGKRVVKTDYVKSTNSTYDIHAFWGGDSVVQGERTLFVSSFADSDQALTIDLTDLYLIPNGDITVSVIGGDTVGTLTSSNFDPAIGHIELGAYDVVATVSDEYDDPTHGTSDQYRVAASTNDYIIGTDLHDWIKTGAGDDYVDSGDAKDAVYLGNGNDTV